MGGGIKKLDDIRTLLNNGADKVVINSAALEAPKKSIHLHQSMGNNVSLFLLM